ncbi:MAG: ATP synthase F0 subunit B [Clostridia bacterium]|nr:ATP synthase F0 subunit B [Clostridia bacterium]
MNIQISVVIWTVICFALLMVILRNLLFKPLLKVMDERSVHLENARKKKSEIDEAIREQEEKLCQQQTDYLEKQKKEISERLASIQAESKNAVIEARRKSLSDVKAYRKSMDAEREKTVSDVSANAKSIAEAFARRIISR